MGDLEGRNILMGEHTDMCTFKDPEILAQFKAEQDKFDLKCDPYQQELMSMEKKIASETKQAHRDWVRKPRVQLAEMNKGPSLDYSFQDLKLISELGTLEPSSGTRKEPPPSEPTLAEGDEKGDEIGDAVVAARPKSEPEQEGKKRPTLITNAIKLSYNELSSLKGLVAAVSEVMEDPIENLTMLDLSHNQLTTIDPEICKFTNLCILYLHGNQITDINQIKKLAKLEKLKILTLHGNCLYIERPGQGKKVKRLEEVPYYRLNVVHRLRGTSLKTLDQVPVTPKERQNALIWEKNHKPKKKE